MIEILPAFREDWEGPENYFRDRQGGPPSHCAIFSEPTGFIRGHWSSLEEGQRQRVFAIAESCMSSGKEPESTAAATCSIENLTKEDLSPEVRRYLGPASREYFDHWRSSS